MKNKFEALEAFRSWPKEWQQLCAEFWAEGDTDESALRTIGDYDSPKIAFGCIDQGDMKLEPVPVRRKAAKRPILHFMRYTRDELTRIDSFLSGGYMPLETARRMDKQHPGQRTVEAWEKMVHRVKKHGLQKMLENAIDMEVE